MGYFARKTTAELTASRELEVGPWFAEAIGAVPGVRAASLLHFALMRIDFVELLKGDMTYIGTAREVGAIAQAMSSTPSVLTIDAIGDRLFVGLGALGFPKAGGGFIQHWDWRIALTPQADRTKLAFDVVEARTSDDALVNASTFKFLVSSLADVLRDGVHFERMMVGDLSAFTGLLDTVDDPVPDRMEWSPLADLELSTDVYGLVPWHLFDDTVPAATRRRLEDNELWPVFRHDRPIPLSRLTSFETRLVAGFLLFAFSLAGADTPERDQLRAMILTLRDAGPPTQVVTRVGRRLANDARFIPVAIGGNEPDVDNFPLMQLAAAPCKIVKTTLSLKKKVELDLYSTTASHDEGLAYLQLGGVSLQADRHPAPKGMEPEWLVRFGNLTKPTPQVDAIAVVKQTQHSHGEMLCSSVAYLELVESTVELLSHQGEVSVWMINRREGWRGVTERQAAIAEHENSDTSEPINHGPGTPAGEPEAGNPPNTATANPARWIEDPTGRHQLRYWDGDEWTEHVSDDGTVTKDDGR